MSRKQSTCIICHKENLRKNKQTCSDDCAKTFVLGLVKPELDENTVIRSYEIPTDIEIRKRRKNLDGERYA